MARGLAVFALIAAACSNSPDVNRAPHFTSPSSATVTENTAGVVYTATASDADGDNLTFSLTAGVDFTLFTITSAGAVTFNDPPNFEGPHDANQDNVYEMQITVTDGTASATLFITITVTDSPEPYRLRRVASGLSAPMFLTGRPGESDVFVIERAGRVRLLDPATGAIAPTPFLDISVDVGTLFEGGFLGFAPAPDYAVSGVFYVHITNTLGDTEIRRYVRSAGDPNLADPGSGDLILTLDQPAGNHNGGWIGFGPDGFLYVALGDGGGSGDPDGNGQNVNTILGAILRIDPSGDDFPADDDRDYAIPPDNPFASGGGAPEIWVYGLRNPFRASFDPDNGDLYIGDVGEQRQEEVDLVPAGESGLNFGWNIREGTLSFTGPFSSDYTQPVTKYDHGSGPRQGNSITGGHVYRGPIALLNGRYFFADFISDNIWSVPISLFVRDGIEVLPESAFSLENSPLTPDAGSLTSIVSFGEDNDRNLYIVSLGGDIFRIEAAP
jgi:hypothetical protein